MKVDCDVHNTVPDISALFPHLPDRWRDYCVEHAVPSLAPNLYPPGVPLSARPDAKQGSKPPGSDREMLRAHVLDNRGADCAILNCLFAVQALHNEDWALAMAQALNDWQAQHWLRTDQRLKASIVVPTQSPERAAEEIHRWSNDPGFIQVLTPLFSQMPLGKRFYWPIYEAAERVGLPVSIHPAVGGGNPLSPTGWPSYYIEDYAGISQAFQSQLMSLVAEGVFQKYSDLTVVLLESGVSWLPSLMWRLNKNWKGLRREVPWVSKLPSEVIREHVRLSVQPFDVPPRAEVVQQLIEDIGSVDGLLFASDYPHWHHRDPEESLLSYLSDNERQRVLGDNAESTYRLTETTKTS